MIELRIDKHLNTEILCLTRRELVIVMCKLKHGENVLYSEIGNEIFDLSHEQTMKLYNGTMRKFRKKDV